MSRLLAECLEIFDRTGIGSDDLQHLPAFDFGQRLLAAQNGKRTIQTACVEFLVEFHLELLNSFRNKRITRLAPSDYAALQVEQVFVPLIG